VRGGRGGRGWGGEGVGGGAHVAWMLVAHLRGVVHRVHLLVVTAGRVSGRTPGRHDANVMQHGQNRFSVTELRVRTVERAPRIGTCTIRYYTKRAGVDSMLWAYWSPHVDQPLQLKAGR
jgi:hypothetical protein